MCVCKFWLLLKVETDTSGGMKVVRKQTDHTNLYGCDLWFHNSAGHAPNFSPKARCTLVYWLLVLPFLFVHCQAQHLHNLLTHNGDIFPYDYDRRIIRHQVDNEYSLINSRIEPRFQDFIPPLRKEEEFIQIPSSEIFPTSFISRFQYAPSPSETSKSVYHAFDPDHIRNFAENSGSITGRYVQGSKVMKDINDAWLWRNNGSGLLNKQTPTIEVAGYIQGINRFHQLPEPKAFSELTDKFLLQAYRSRSPCFDAKVDWVRDTHNCSVFFVCARGRAAAIMTCPLGENWSNRVTNCVPILSRWDDCLDTRQPPHAAGEEVTQPVRSTLKPRKVRRRWRKIVTTTKIPLQTPIVEKQIKQSEDSNVENNQRYYTRQLIGHGRYYQTGGRRLNLAAKNRRGGYRVHRIHNSAKRQQNVHQSQHFHRRRDDFVWNDGSNNREHGRIPHEQHRFEAGSLVTRGIGMRKRYRPGSGRLQLMDNESTSTQQPTITTSSQFPIAASGSGNRPKFRYRIMQNKQRRLRLKLGKAKIKKVKDADLDFLNNIKRVNEFEDDAIRRPPKINHTPDPVESTTIPSTTETGGEESHWWLDMSTEEQPTPSSTVSSSTISTTENTTTEWTTTSSTTMPTPLEKSKTSSRHRYTPGKTD